MDKQIIDSLFERIAQSNAPEECPADSFVFVRIVLKLTDDDDDTTDILCHISFLPLDGVPEEVEKPYRKLREDRVAEGSRRS